MTSIHPPSNETTMPVETESVPAGARQRFSFRLPSTSALEGQLAERAYAHIPNVLDGAQCAHIRSLYENKSLFRSRIIMARHGFGRGEYQYFGYPLPRWIASLREQAYSRLRDVANAWHAALGNEERFEPEYRDYLARCHAAGQSRPTPLLLKYGPGDENRLHQDLYGEHLFPFQLAVLLSEPGRDFCGGEFALTEQRPRQQSRVIVPPFGLGDGLVFPVRYRPVPGSRGAYRAVLRHGVSEVRSGERYVLGVIMHDAA